MRRGAVAIFAVLLVFALLLGGDFTPRTERIPVKHQMIFADQPTIAPVLTMTPTPFQTATPSPRPTLSPSPVPRIDAPWYDARNTALKTLIKRNDPERKPEEIDLAVQAMYIDPNKPMVALTFDDGPMPGVTDKILDILEQYNARATFFVCGWRFKDDGVADLARRMVSLGCEIGNHTTEHTDLSKQNVVEIRDSIEQTNKIVYDATGYVMHSLRPPGGHNEWNVNRIARSDDMAVVLWSQSGNVHEFDPVKVAENVQKQSVNGKELQDGDIILLHDTKPHMVDAVEIIVPQLLEEGYQLVTVWELLNCSEEGFTPGVTYRHQ